MSLAVLRLIGASKVLRFLAPDVASTVGRSDNIFLSVCGPKDNVSSQAQRENSCCLEGGQVCGVASEILALDRIDVRYCCHTAPPKVETEMVVGYVDGTKIPVFIDKEIQDVDEM